MTEVDRLWLLACGGDREAFGDWVGRVEHPIRRRLGPYARAVDTESVMQETLLRMWLYAQEPSAPLTGENASLRFALGMARNVARNMARWHGREVLLPPEDLPEHDPEPEPAPDPFLRRAIRECFEKLARKPRQALSARMSEGHRRDDRELALALGMTANTFLQNIVRARRQLGECLGARGIRVHEVAR